MAFPFSDVSRETLDDFLIYEELVRKWNPSINLIAKSTLHEIQTRHILDSLQIAKYVPENPKKWIDMGTGGGFPGLVMAIAAKVESPATEFFLIESDQRKAAFLRTVVRETGSNCTVLAKRVEEVVGLSADLISARALAPLGDLLELAHIHQNIGARLLFLKGRRFETEVEEARKQWNFSIDAHPSLTDKEARILDIWGLERAN